MGTASMLSFDLPRTQLDLTNHRGTRTHTRGACTHDAAQCRTPYVAYRIPGDRRIFSAENFKNTTYNSKRHVRDITLLEMR
mmetsp:Transcript_14400/g.23694  ORF Transcript_14400/g.23694 Transcript_14400/m.23694 type:complete len:81 (-) Transcript_14400:64-306(-)